MACEQTRTSETNDNQDSAQQSVAPPNQLGNLHKRRAETSPEKFNTGQFEPLQLQTVVTTKKIRTDDGTPRTVTRVENSPQKTQLTAFLSNFNLTPTTPTARSDIKESRDIEQVKSLHTLRSSQLTAGLNNFNIATLKANAIPLSSIPTTPKTAKKKPFNLLNAFCANNELLLLLTSYLTIPSLISLYSISKVYHHQFNYHYTAHMLAIMRTWAPHSEIAFPWRNYRSLCIRDPALRQTSRLAGTAEGSSDKYGDLRSVPTIRWLQMVVYRHGVCTDILIRLASYGHRCPAGTLEALKVSTPSLHLYKSILTTPSPHQHLWFLLDLPTTNQRTLAIRSQTYFPSAALLNLTHLFLKIDMHFTDPAGRVHPPANHPLAADPWRHPPRFASKGFVGTHLRQTLLAERSLTPLWRVLRGWTWDPREPPVHMDRLDVVKLWARHYYHPDEDDDLDPRARAQSVLGVPFALLGTAQLEGFGQMRYTVDGRVLEEMVSLEGDGTWGPVVRASVTPLRPVRQVTAAAAAAARRPPGKLLRVDQLVMREGVRRELKMWEHWVRIMVWGWHDPLGRRLPLWSEEQLMRMRKGLPPNVIGRRASAVGQNENGSKSDDVAENED